MATDRQRELIDHAAGALERVVDDLGVVLAQLDDEDSPWPILLGVLIRERVGRAQADMRQLLKRVDVDKEPEPKRQEPEEQSA